MNSKEDAKRAEDVYQRVVKISRCGRRLATAGTDGFVKLWRLPDPKLVSFWNYILIENIKLYFIILLLLWLPSHSRARKGGGRRNNKQMWLKGRNLFILDDNFTTSPFLTEKVEIVFNNNFDNRNRGAPIWFRDIYCKFNSRGIFLRILSIIGELSSRRLLEYCLTVGTHYACNIFFWSSLFVIDFYDIKVLQNAQYW